MFSKTFCNHRQIVEALKKSDFASAASLCADHILEVGALISQKSKQQAKLGQSSSMF
jgi:DNA-binding GntR family transcriptional regulator